ncbi:MAG: hypothetical protein RLY50_1325 [Actinomycetota bacterium]|jgi:hypothetical protein
MWPFTMDDAGFILLSWVLSLVATGGYAAWVVRRGKALSRYASREELPWT